MFKKILPVSFLWIFLSVCVPLAHAGEATLYLSPVTGTYIAGTPFTVKILMNSGGESINVIEGKLLYDPQKIEVVSVSETRSVITSWTQPPSIDHVAGSIAFGGFLATPSVLDRGEVLAVLLRPRGVGEAELYFESGSAAVRTADGTGGNILSTLNRGVYVITEEEAIPERAIAPVSDAASDSEESEGEVLGAATELVKEIVSSTHPDQEHWYKETTGVLSWEMLSDTVETRLLLSERPSGRGIISYVPPINTKTLTDLEDGIWYVHVTEVSSLGTEQTRSFRMNIDTSPPSNLSITEDARERSTDSKVTFTIMATDTLSGIERYALSIDGGEAIVREENGDHEYQLGPFSPGSHELTVSVYDRAGNVAMEKKAFTVEALPSPTIVLGSTNTKEGKPLHLFIETVSKGTVTISISRNSEPPIMEDISVDENGKAEYRTRLLLLPGTYEIWATVRADNGAQSYESDRLSVVSGSSLSGVLKRHPFVLIAGIAFLMTIVLSIVLWRRLVKSHTRDHLSHDPDPLLLKDVSSGKVNQLKTFPQHSSAVVILGDLPKK